MKLKTAFAATTALAAVFLIGSVVVAGDDTNQRGSSHHGEFKRGPGGHHGSDMMVGGRLLEKLDLTPEQRDAVDDVMQTAKPAMHEAHQARRDNQKRLMAITPDDAAFAATVDEVAQANAELAARSTRLAAQTAANVWALLTDAQKAQALELRADMQQRKAERRAERGSRREADEAAE